MSFKIIDIDPHKSPTEHLNKYIDYLKKLNFEQAPKSALYDIDRFLALMVNKGL